MFANLFPGTKVPGTDGSSYGTQKNRLIEVIGKVLPVKNTSK